MFWEWKPTTSAVGVTLQYPMLLFIRLKKWIIPVVTDISRLVFVFHKTLFGIMTSQALLSYRYLSATVSFILVLSSLPSFLSFLVSWKDICADAVD